MPSQYAKGRRHEENLVNLLKDNGFDARRIELSGRWRKDKADIMIVHNGSAIYASAKYGKAVPKVLYKGDIVTFPGVMAVSFPFEGGIIYEAKRLPKFISAELEMCPLFFGKRARQPWKVAFAESIKESSVIRLLESGRPRLLS